MKSYSILEIKLDSRMITEIKVRYSFLDQQKCFDYTFKSLTQDSKRPIEITILELRETIDTDHNFILSNVEKIFQNYQGTNIWIIFQQRIVK